MRFYCPRLASASRMGALEISIGSSSQRVADIALATGSACDSATTATSPSPSARHTGASKLVAICAAFWLS